MKTMREYWDEFMALSEEERQRLCDLQDSRPPYHGKTMGKLLDERREQNTESSQS